MTKPKLSILRHLEKSLGLLAGRMGYGAKKYDVEGVQSRSATEYMDKALRHTLAIRPTVLGRLDASSTQHAIAGAFNLLAMVEMHTRDEDWNRKHDSDKSS